MTLMTTMKCGLAVQLQALEPYSSLNSSRGYYSSQDTSGSVEERDNAQRRNIVMFLPSFLPYGRNS